MRMASCCPQGAEVPASRAGAARVGTGQAHAPGAGDGWDAGAGVCYCGEAARVRPGNTRNPGPEASRGQRLMPSPGLGPLTATALSGGGSMVASMPRGEGGPQQHSTGGQSYW